MKAVWLKNDGKDSKNKLILFFAGWGMNEKPFLKFGGGAYDVLMIYDHRNLEIPAELTQIKKYQTVNVIAWSLGVWVFNYIKEDLGELNIDIELSIAINGTIFPIHARFGIDPGIFQATLDNLSLESVERFYQNIFTKPQDARTFLSVRPDRGLTDLENELKFLQTNILKTQLNGSALSFDKAIIGKYDVIIPAKNQARFWNGRCEYKVIQNGHFPFYRWKNWEEVINYARDD